MFVEKYYLLSKTKQNGSHPKSNDIFLYFNTYIHWAKFNYNHIERASEIKLKKLHTSDDNLLIAKNGLHITREK